MANAIKWEAAPTALTDLIPTGMDSLGIGLYSAVSTTVDNDTALAQYAMVEIYIPSIVVPTGGGYMNVHLIPGPDGTNFADSATPGVETIVATLTTPAATAAIRKTSALFRIPPIKFRLVVYNGFNVALTSSGNILNLYTCNDEIQ